MTLATYWKQQPHALIKTNDEVIHIEVNRGWWSDASTSPINAALCRVVPSLIPSVKPIVIHVHKAKAHSNQFVCVSCLKYFMNGREGRIGACAYRVIED